MTADSRALQPSLRRHHQSQSPYHCLELCLCCLRSVLVCQLARPLRPNLRVKSCRRSSVSGEEESTRDTGEGRRNQASRAGWLPFRSSHRTALHCIAGEERAMHNQEGVPAVVPHVEVQGQHQQQQQQQQQPGPVPAGSAAAPSSTGSSDPPSTGLRAPASNGYTLEQDADKHATFPPSPQRSSSSSGGSTVQGSSGSDNGRAATSKEKQELDAEKQQQEKPHMPGRTLSSATTATVLDPNEPAGTEKSQALWRCECD